MQDAEDPFDEPESDEPAENLITQVVYSMSIAMTHIDFFAIRLELVEFTM